MYFHLHADMMATVSNGSTCENHGMVVGVSTGVKLSDQDVQELSHEQQTSRRAQRRTRVRSSVVHDHALRLNRQTTTVKSVTAEVAAVHNHSIDFNCPRRAAKPAVVWRLE